MGGMRTVCLLVLTVFLILGCDPIDLRLTINETVKQPGWGLLSPPLTAGSDGSSGDFFGISVDASENYLIVGAYASPESGSNRGAAYIFTKIGDEWVKQQKLVSNDPADNDLFGGAVAISENYAVVASTGQPDEIEIFERSGGVWSSVVEFDTGGGNGFGRSVDVNGTHIIVGDDQNDLARFYHRSGGVWIYKSQVNPAGADSFGRSVSIYDPGTLEGVYAVVGAEEFDGAVETDIGAAYIYQWDGANWAPIKELKPDVEVNSELFGRSVSAYDDLIIVGAPGTASSYIYKLSGAEWIADGKISIGGVLNADIFGNSVSVTDRMAVIGAYSANGQTGAAYIVEKYGDEWDDDDPFSATGGAATDRFGFSVSIFDNFAFVGAYQDDNDIGVDAGTVYVFKRESITGIRNE
jgi:hypothetical protein